MDRDDKPMMGDCYVLPMGVRFEVLETRRDAAVSAYIATLPRFLQGPNTRRVIRNMANGGARLRTFMRHDGGIAMRQLATIADQFGAVSRTLRARVMTSALR